MINHKALKIMNISKVQPFGFLLFLWLICLGIPQVGKTQDLGQWLNQLNQTENVQEKIKLYNQIGQYYQQQQAYAKSIEYLEKAYRLEKETNDLNGQLQTLPELAKAYIGHKKYRQAKSSYLALIKLQKQESDQKAVLNTLNQLILLTESSQEYDKAIEYSLRALEIQKQFNNSIGLINTYNNLGYLYERTNDKSQALAYHKKAIELSRQVKREENDPKTLANLYLNLGVAYTKEGDHKKAKSHFLEALEILEREGTQEEIAQVYNYLATSNYLSSRNEQALNNALKAQELAQRAGSDETLLVTYQILSNIYQKEGEYRESQRNYKLYQELKNELAEEKQKQEQALLEKQINFEKKEGDLLMFIAEREKQNLALRQSELEREKKEKELALQAKELALLKQQQELQAAALRNQELEKERVNQLLLLAEEKARNEKQKRENERQKKRALEQELIAEREKAENLQKQKELEAAKKDQELQEQQLEQEATIRQYALWAIVILSITIGLICYFLLQNRRKSKELKNANEAMQRSQAEVESKNQELEYQKNALEKTYQTLEHKNNALMDSITYAERIQEAILPSSKELTAIFNDLFIIYNPKDIVSGDFYWYNQVEDKIFVAVVDCTGHGVPGAFMSLIGNALLNEIVNQKRILDTNKILEELHAEVRNSLKQKETNNMDGMELILCRFQRSRDNEYKIQFSGAKNSLYYVHDGELLELKGDRQGIGGYQHVDDKKFTPYHFTLQPGDKLYMTTDGLLDAPNPKRRRFGRTKLRNFILENAHHPMPKQEKILLSILHNHSQDTLQRDDVTMLGLQLSEVVVVTEESAKDKNVKVNNGSYTSHPQSDFSLYEYHTQFSGQDILLSYKGPLSDHLLAEFSREVREKVQSSPKAGKKVFSIFMELAQNVLFYSKESNFVNKFDPVGTLAIIDNGDSYRIIAGNLVYKSAVMNLKDKCDKVNSMDRDNLREYKRMLRNAPKGEESRGAGIGMVQAALTSQNPLHYEIREFGDDYAFYLISVIVAKSKKTSSPKPL